MRRNFVDYAKERKNIEKEEEQTKRRPSVARGMIALAVVGVGGGIYGFVRGTKFGYRQGFRKGELYANDQFRDLAKELIRLREESKGE